MHPQTRYIDEQPSTTTPVQARDSETPERCPNCGYTKPRIERGDDAPLWLAALGLLGLAAYETAVHARKVLR